MLNIGRIRPGGADYYVAEIATSAAAYYLGHGEAPGRWVGSLAAEMGLHDEVDPDHFRALLGGKHPLTGEQLVDPPRAKTRNVSIRPEGEWLTAEEAATQLGVSTRFVRRLLVTGKLEGEKARSETTGRVAWRVQRAHVNTYAVSHPPSKRRPGFDLTLRPPKSVSVLWALADRERRAAIHQVHREAVDEVVRYYESEAVMARHRGGRIQTAGLVAAAFDHRTSRAGDPLLHTHVVAANLTLTVADAWRALDGRLLYDHALSGGHLYQAHLRHLLSERLGIEWGPIDKGMADVEGVPQAVIDEFSQRRDEIEEMLAESGYTSARAHQAATLATRRPKDHSVNPDTPGKAWRERAASLGFDEQAVEGCFGRAVVPQRAPADIERVFAYLGGPSGLTERASTFTRRDVVRDVAAAMGDRATAIEIERLSDRFLASDRVVLLAGPTSGRNSQVVVGLDNRRVRTGGTALFSTPELVDIETRLLRWADNEAGPVAEHHAVEQVLACRPELSDEQRAMVRAVCSTSRAIQVIVGRPGSGKTYATAACVESFAANGIPIVGCAVSATAAAELEAAVGFRRFTRRPAQTIASLLVDLDQRGDHLAPGTVLMVDEASMVGTRDLARLAAQVQRVGGSIKLIGDPDQHTSVETGGIFKALAARDDPSIVRLVENRRQTDPSERAAIADYRRGQIGAALDRYDSGGKIVRAATAAATYDVLVRDWWSDRRAGSTSSMLAGTNAARRALNDRARSLLKKEGVLSGHPLVVHRREFMIGDEVVARRNDRALRCPGRSEFVKNGSTGRVTGIDHAGRQVDVAFANEGTIRIPSDYLDAGHLDHAYARTTFGVQGTTLDRARYHPADASRFEEGYVAITRATEITNLYVVEGEVEVDDDVDSRAVQRPETGLAVVANALTRRSDDKLAVASDPRAIDAGRLAKEYSLCQLREHRQEVEALLQLQPPSVAGELAEARGRAEGLKARQAVVADQLASWSPKRHRNAARQMASLQAAIINAEARIAELETAQERHEDFAVEHADEFAQHDLLRRAEGARRLQVRIAAVADPPPAIAAALGPRPATQRDRLRWDRAAEAVAVYLDENDRHPPDAPCSIAELLGPRPKRSLDGYGYDMVVRAIRQRHAPEREHGAPIALR